MNIIDEMLCTIDRKENDFPVIDEQGRFLIPNLSKNGIRQSYTVAPDDYKYKGLVLEINDHGNITVWRQFKNGKRTEIKSKV